MNIARIIVFPLVMLFSSSISGEEALPVNEEEKSCEDIYAEFFSDYKKLRQVASEIKSGLLAEDRGKDLKDLLQKLSHAQELISKAKPASPEKMRENMEEYVKYMRENRDAILALAADLEKKEFYGSRELANTCNFLSANVESIYYRDLRMDVESLTMNYYKEPSPEKISAMMEKHDLLLKRGMDEGAKASVTGFYSEIFKQNPDRLRGWVNEISTLSGQSKTTLMTALWLANTKESIAQLKRYAESDPLFNDKAENPDKGQYELMALEKCTDPAMLDMAWGAFFASGNKAYVESLVRCAVRPQPKDGSADIVPLAARWSLTALAKSNAEVKKYLDDYLKTLTDTQRKEFSTSYGNDDMFNEYSMTP